MEISVTFDEGNSWITLYVLIQGCIYTCGVLPAYISVPEIYIYEILQIICLHCYLTPVPYIAEYW